MACPGLAGGSILREDGGHVQAAIPTERRYPPELKERAVRIVQEAITSVAWTGGGDSSGAGQQPVNGQTVSRACTQDIQT